MKMYEAALAVLNDVNKPMHAKEIHAEIVRRGLFQFGAKSPVSILSQTLRDKSVGGRKPLDPVFVRTAPGNYGLVGWENDLKG